MNSQQGLPNGVDSKHSDPARITLRQRFTPTTWGGSWWVTDTFNGLISGLDSTSVRKWIDNLQCLLWVTVGVMTIVIEYAVTVDIENGPSNHIHGKEVFIPLDGLTKLDPTPIES